uniref:MD-2-related lipid-recognition domain-containing protein n=1 Tax=Timema genevievae TaxID=629358 RepID=A0A7R9JP82_TIMGE|nr:unnamed protein product [Timema genevievae]
MVAGAVVDAVTIMIAHPEAVSGLYIPRDSKNWGQPTRAADKLDRQQLTATALPQCPGMLCCSLNDRPCCVSSLNDRPCCVAASMTGMLCFSLNDRPCCVSAAIENVPRNCTVNEVRVDPCSEAAQKKACKVKKGTAASISFDFTPGVSASSLSSRAYWASTTDIPFIGMDTDACEYTNCLTVAGQQQTYSFNLQIPSRKVQTMVYDVKWKLWDDNSMECCFLIKIHITK